ncbi:MAG: hypothetical protein QOI35_3981 [Cryptosporangiaceae bacterium]|nr:hypothetical protein [Cryptosporangiaceae bacterium]
MTRLSHDRYCAEIAGQTSLLTAALPGVDLATPVPSCPGWTVNQLLRHLGWGQRGVAWLVRARATEPPSEAPFRDLSGYVGEDPAVLAEWLAESAADLAGALRDAGPDAAMWTPLDVEGGAAAFFARRFAHETVMHRADAVLALGGEFILDPDLATDGLDEWTELGSLPQMFDFHPERRALLGPGRTLALHATDTGAAWLIDLTGDALALRRGLEDAAVTVRGSARDLLLTAYRRQPADSPGIEVTGDAALLSFYLAENPFG